MPWFARDYDDDTFQLEPMADLLYRRLLDVFWRSKCHLKFEPEMLLLCVRYSQCQWQRHWSAISSFWQIDDEGYLHNRRAEAEWDYACRLVDGKRRAGKLGASKRWRNLDSSANGSANGVAIDDASSSANGAGVPSRSRPRVKTPPPLSEVAPPAKKSKRKSAAPDSEFNPLAIDLPGCVSAFAWREFVGHRNDIAKPLSERASRMALSTLCRASEAGETPEAVIERSVIGRWSGLHPDCDRHRPTGVNQHEPGPKGAISRYAENALAWAHADDARRAADAERGGGERPGGVEDKAAGVLPDPGGLGPGRGDDG